LRSWAQRRKLLSAAPFVDAARKLDEGEQRWVCEPRQNFEDHGWKRRSHKSLLVSRGWLQRVAGFNKILRLAPMLLSVVLNASVGTALRIFRDPGLPSPLGRGAIPILIAGGGGKFCASLSKKAWRFGYNI
jgi:hypothetical protein